MLNRSEQLKFYVKEPSEDWLAFTIEDTIPFDVDDQLFAAIHASYRLSGTIISFDEDVVENAFTFARDGIDVLARKS